MKLLICNYLDNTTMNKKKLQNKLLWRIPYLELKQLKWETLNRNEILKFNLNKYSISKYLLQIYKKIPETILVWIQSEYDEKFRKIIEECSKLNSNTYIYIDDLHYNIKNKNRNLYIDSILTSNYKNIICSYGYCFEKFHKKRNNVTWVPHSAYDSYSIEFNKNPKPKILLTGAIDIDIYPIRYKVRMMAKINKNIDVLQHFGYKKLRHDICGEKYIKHLNKYLICFTCCSISEYPYVISKFFEIPQSGSLLLAYDKYIKLQLLELGFIDGYNYISVNDDNLEEKIDYVLNKDNIDKINEIRLNGYNFILTNHMLSDRASQINSMINK